MFTMEHFLHTYLMRYKVVRNIFVIYTHSMLDINLMLHGTPQIVHKCINAKHDIR